MIETSTQAVTDALRERILEGAFAPGEKLNQDFLAHALGVSRTPLRTALAALANEGLLVYAPNRGFTMRAFRIEDIRAAFDVRARLEGHASSLAARHRSDALDAELARCVEVGDAVLAKGRLDPEDLPRYRRMNVGYHDAIIRAADNPWIADFVRRTHSVPLASDRVILWSDFAVIARSHDDHHRIRHAIAKGDTRRAGNLMEEHVVFAGEVLVSHLEENGGLSALRTIAASAG